MKLSPALLLAALPAAHGGRTDAEIPAVTEAPYVPSNGFSAGSCLDDRYQVFHPGSPLTCDAARSDGKFWTRVSLKAPETCVEGRRLKIEDLGFGARFKGSRRDFAVYAYSGESPTDATLPDLLPDVAPIYGDRCAVQSLTSANDDSSDPLAVISDVDGDTCHDVTVSGDGMVETDVAFMDSFTIPCTDYKSDAEAAESDELGIKRTVKLQFCSSWRSEEEDNRCDIVGPHPCSPMACWCDTIDLGVEIVAPEDAVPTCAPNKDMDPTAAPSQKPTPAPSKEPTPSPTPAPIVITPSPTKNPTPSPTLAAIVTPEPTSTPSVMASEAPSVAQSDEPSAAPSIAKSHEPSAAPSGAPTELSAAPSGTPTCDNSTVTAVDDFATTEKDTAITLSVLDNDVPVEGFPLHVASLPFAGRHGTCVISEDRDGTATFVEYTPAPGYYGEDTCVYQACDTASQPRCDVATITITIPATDGDVTAIDDTASTAKNTPVDVTVLANDLAVEGHPLTVDSIATAAEHGECVITSDSVVMYVPAPGFVGSDSCVYRACDDREKCDTATVILEVTGDSAPCDDDKKLVEPTEPAIVAPTTTTTTTTTTSTTTTTPEPTKEPTDAPSLAKSDSPSAVPSGAPSCSGPKCSTPTVDIGLTTEPTATSAPSSAPSCGGEPCATPTTDIDIGAATPAPTLCGAGLKWHYLPNVGCTNQAATADVPLYDSLDECCAAESKPGKCASVDVCAPTASPTEAPSASPSASPSDSPSASPSASPSDSPSAPPSASPSAAPTLSAAPTACADRKWHFFVWNGCTNAVAVDSESDDAVYDSLDACCAARYGDAQCVFADVCAPTASPTDEPTPSPTDEPTPSPTPAPSAKPVADTLRPTTPFPTLAMIPEETPEPTSVAFGKTPEPTPEPTPAPTTVAPSWGGTPTVGTDKEPEQINARPEGRGNGKAKGHSKGKAKGAAKGRGRKKMLRRRQM